MKMVSKYSTFEDLKSSEKKPLDYELSLEKHNEFKRVIKSLKSTKVRKDVFRESK